MISGWELYLWSRLGVFGEDTLVAVILGVAVVAGLLLVYSVSDGFESWGYKEKERRRKRSIVRRQVRKLLLFCLVWCVLSAITPTKKDAALIYIVPKLANSEVLKQEASDIYFMAKRALSNDILIIKEDDDE